MQRLELLKALGDNTRYAIYLEIARSPSPRSTAEIAESLGLHPNTVRPHLERMREVGLLDVEVDARGTVGRPQHRYSLAADAPSLGLEPPAFPTLAGMLAAVAAQSRPGADDVAEVGRAQGRTAAERVLPAAFPVTGAAACVAALERELGRLGFDPASDRADADPGADAEGLTMIAFTHCPYRELAEAYPELVCNLHRGIVEGFVEAYATRFPEPSAALAVDEFHSLADRTPCQVALRNRYPAHNHPEEDCPA